MLRFIAAAGVVAATAAAGHAQTGEGSAVFRYRAAIAALMQLKAGMTAAEVAGAAPAVVDAIAPLVGDAGHALTAGFDAATGVTTLPAASLDAVVLTGALPRTTAHAALFASLARALKPGGVLLVVDVPQESDGKRTVGLEAEDVVTIAAAAGLKRDGESGIVPGHYAIRFRKG